MQYNIIIEIQGGEKLSESEAIKIIILILLIILAILIYINRNQKYTWISLIIWLVILISFIYETLI